MSDTILRKAHMSAITEISSLKRDIHRLETGLIVAECMNNYLAARLELHGKPYRMDVAVLRLGQVAMSAEDPRDADMAIEALKQLLSKCREFTVETMREMASEITIADKGDEEACDFLIRKVLAKVDDKLADYKKSIVDQAGITEDDMEQIRREIEKRFGLDKDSK